MATESGLPDPRRVGAIIVSAGASSRMGGLDKTLAPLRGETLIAWTVEVFVRSPHVGKDLIQQRPDVASGGRTRSASASTRCRRAIGWWCTTARDRWWALR